MPNLFFLRLARACSQIDDFFSVYFYLSFFLRPHDIWPQAIIFYPWTFLCERKLTIRDGPAGPRQKYISGRVLDVARKMHSDISPTPPLIFTARGVQKLRNLALYSTTLELESLRFGNQQDIFTIFELGERRWWFYVLPKFGVVRPIQPLRTVV